MNRKDELEKILLNFVQRYKHIILYGAGDYGRVYCLLLKENNIDISGFLVSNRPSDIKFLGYPIFGVDEVPFLKDECGIILSLEDRWHEEIKTHLIESGFHHIFCTNQILSMYLFVKTLFMPKNDVTFFSQKYPIQPFKGTTSWQRILIVRLDAIGDMVVTIPFIRELRRNFLGVRIDLVMRKDAYNLMELCPYIDHIFIYHCQRQGGFDREKAAQKALGFARENLIDVHYDVVFLPRSSADLVGNIYVAIYSGASIRIGHSVDCIGADFLGNDRSDELLSIAVKDEKEKYHEVERDLRLLTVIGKEFINDKIELWLDDCDEQFAQSFLLEFCCARDSFLVAVVLSGSTAVKTWSLSKFETVLQHLHKKFPHIKFVFFGGKEDVFLIERLMLNFSGKYVLDMTGRTTLRQAAALLKRCQLYFGCDTGLKHIAAAVGVDVIELSAGIKDEGKKMDWSPTRYGAWGVKDIVLQPAHGLDDCVGVCRRTYAHCINQITVEEVEQAFDLYMRENGYCVDGEYDV